MNPLVELAAERDHHPTAFFKLLDERAGHLGRGAGDDDGVERGSLGPASVTVANSGVDVRVAQLLVDLGGSLTEKCVDLDRVDILDELREDRRLIARAGANLVDLVGLFGFENLGHEGHVIGRGHGLPFADIDRLVIVGPALGLGREELEEPVARDRPESVEHPLVLDPSFDQVMLNHPGPGGLLRILLFLLGLGWVVGQGDEGEQRGHCQAGRGSEAGSVICHRGGLATNWEKKNGLVPGSLHHSRDARARHSHSFGENSGIPVGQGLPCRPCVTTAGRALPYEKPSIEAILGRPSDQICGKVPAKNVTAKLFPAGP